MKKVLFLFAAVIISMAAMSQTPTITINNVVPGEQGGYKGDYITFTIESTSASGYAVGFIVYFGKFGVGSPGGYGYPQSEMFSHKTITLTKFWPLLNKFANKDRTWKVSYSYIPDNQNDPNDPYPWTVQDTYTVSK